MKLDTYLNFDGNCREAFEFYREALGGEFEEIHTFAEALDDVPVAEEYRQHVMHVSLPVGPSLLMGSDSVPGFGPPEFVAGNNFSIMVHVDSKGEADAIFARLSEGGMVGMPLEETFWGGYFGSLTDKFGVNWQIHHDLADG